MQTDIRLIQYNLESGRGVTEGYSQYTTHIFKRRAPIARAARMLADLQPDILFLTEIERASLSSSHDQLDMVSDALQAKSAFFPTSSLRRLWVQGTAIISRHARGAARSYELPGGFESRVLGELALTVAGVDTLAYVTHLSLSARARKLQMQAIADILRGKMKPIILAGDFNTTDLREVAALEALGLRYVAAATYPSWDPSRQLDYIFCSPDFDILTHSVSAEQRFSDHLPLVADVRAIAGPFTAS
jgi:endonuclease/exonuclease/phosphatase family metal-dependent hydrolase